MSEDWASIPDFPGYEASTEGRIRSYYQHGPSGKKADTPQRVLNPSDTHNLYKAVILYKGGARYYRPVHALTLAAFVPRPDATQQVNHKNGIKADNRLANLEWVTPSENILHSIQVLGNGPNTYGESHHNARLTNEDVLAIRAAYDSGSFTQKELAVRWNITPSQISRIVRRKRWKQI